MPLLERADSVEPGLTSGFRYRRRGPNEKGFELFRGTIVNKRTNIAADLAHLRSALASHRIDRCRLLHVGIGRPIADVAFDVSMCLLVTACASRWECGFPFAVLLIGNRQRAIGNILHDAGHRNLSRRRWINDGLAVAVVAPLALASLRAYRASHFAHHLELGHARDPDLLPGTDTFPAKWWHEYLRQVSNGGAWMGSVGGHVLDQRIALIDRVWIVVWWTIWLGTLGHLLGEAFAMTFAALWLLARATTFHAITMLREMCDHHGLQPGGGVFSFTRDMACSGPWRWLIHPRNNGSDLTHHLLPAVPYYRLPEAHRILMTLPEIRQRSNICFRYFGALQAVTADWQQASPRSAT